MKFGSWRFKIASVLTLAFGGLALLSTGIMLYFSLDNTLQATRSSLSARLEQLINEATDKSLAFYQPAEQQARWLAEEIKTGRIDPNDRAKFSSVLKGAVSLMPQISAVSYQFADGTGYFFDSKSKDLVAVEWPRAWQVPLNQSETNPQTRPRADGIWVLRPSVIDGDHASTFIAPVRTDNGDLGAVAIRLELATLSDRLAVDSTFRGHELVRFILFNRNIVVGHPELKGMKRLGRPTLEDLKDPYLKILDSAEREQLALVADIPNVEAFALDTDLGRRIFVVRSDPNRQAGGGEIMIGIHFDSMTAEAEIKRLLSVALVGIGLLLGSMLVAWLLGRWAAKPIKKLAITAQQVQNNQLDEVEPLPASRIVEVSSAANAFNEMVEGLKERAKIRDLFGKYVPQDVANLLLTDDRTAEPQNATATVLFLDIVGFSTLSEKLPPAEVVATMNAFFSDAVAEIEKERGMVTQFQGDAILAVFNVPIEQDGHAQAAIRAANRILERIGKETFAGQTLDCRIGINTGQLVAGAIGAEDRLSYTVYGDAVNVAARLEQMNKEFKTRLLVAEESVNSTEGFDFEDIGEVPIRGRSQPVKVFTLH